MKNFLFVFLLLLSGFSVVAQDKIIEVTLTSGSTLAIQANEWRMITEKSYGTDIDYGYGTTAVVHRATNTYDALASAMCSSGIVTQIYIQGVLTNVVINVRYVAKIVQKPNGKGSIVMLQSNKVWDTNITYAEAVDLFDNCITSGGGGGGATNLSFTRTATTLTVTSDTGSDAVIPAATTSLSGVLSSTDKTKLDGLSNYTAPNHTGDVISVGDGATTIVANAVDNTKLADMPATTLKGNNTGTSGNPADLTVAQTKALLAYAGSDVSNAPAGSINTTTIQGALNELDNEKQINVSFQEDGSALGTAGTVTTVNFTGTGVTASRAANVLTVNVPTSGGGGLVDGDYGDIDVKSGGTVIKIDTLGATNGQVLTWNGSSWVPQSVTADNIENIDFPAYAEKTHIYVDSIAYNYNGDKLEVIIPYGDGEGTYMELENGDDFRHITQTYVGTIVDGMNSSSYTGTWSNALSISSASTIGSAMTVNFTGTAIYFQHYSDPNGGIWSFQVDGGATTSVSTFSNPGAFLNRVLLFSGLTNTAHTVVGTYVSGGTKAWIHNYSPGSNDILNYSTFLVVGSPNVDAVVKTYDIQKDASIYEFAINIRPANNPTKPEQWIPSHGGANTCFYGPDSLKLYIDGVRKITSTNGYAKAKSINLSQNLYGYYIDSIATGKQYADIKISHLFKGDEVNILNKVEWKRAAYGSGYLMMAPISTVEYDTLYTSLGQKINLDVTNGSGELITYGDLCNSFLFKSNTRAVRLLTTVNGGGTKRTTGPAQGGGPFFLEHRNNSLQKLYCKSYEAYTSAKGDVDYSDFTLKFFKDAPFGSTKPIQVGSLGSTYTAGSGISISGNTISNSGDLSSTNEIQTLSIDGSDLTLSNGGGTVNLPSGGSLPSGTDKQTLRYSGTTLTANSNITNSGTKVTIGGATEVGRLSVRGEDNVTTPCLTLERLDGTIMTQILNNGAFTHKLTAPNPFMIVAPTSSADGNILMTLKRPNGGEIAYFTDRSEFVMSGNMGFYPTTDGGATVVRGASGLFVGNFNAAASNAWTGNFVSIGRHPTQDIITIGGVPTLVSIVGKFAPTSGSGVFSALKVEPIVNQTGATGAVIGVNYSPTITSVTGPHYGLLIGSGKAGFNVPAPTAKVHIAAGTATEAPFKLTSGTNLTTPEAGAIEYNGTDLFVTNSTANRYQVARAITASASLDYPSIAPLTTVTLTITVTGATTQDFAVVQPVSGVASNTVITSWVSGPDTVTVSVANLNGIAIDPPSQTFNVKVIKN